MVTATHDRRRDPRARVNALQEWGQRSVFGAARGWPWWGAVLLALGLSIVGAFIDMQLSGNLSKVFEGAYFLGCVGAVCLVRRRSVFGPMVQPPLVLAVTIPVVVLLTKGMPAGSGLTAKLLALGVPLVTGFPTMAITTGATVVIGGIRYLVQRKPISVRDEDDWDDLDDRGDARRRAADRGAADRGADRDGGRGERPASGRPRPGSGSGGRPAAGRTSRDEGDSPRERRRAPRSRSESPGRDERSTRSSGERDRGQGRDPERRTSRDRAQGDRGQNSRGQSRDRGQAPRGGARPSRDDGRRQPPPRRRDEDR